MVAAYVYSNVLQAPRPQPVRNGPQPENIHEGIWLLSLGFRVEGLGLNFTNIISNKSLIFTKTMNVTPPDV